MYIYIRPRLLDCGFNDFCDKLEHVRILLTNLSFQTLFFSSSNSVSLDIISNDLLSENICLFRKIN